MSIHIGVTEQEKLEHNLNDDNFIGSFLTDKLSLNNGEFRRDGSRYMIVDRKETVIRKSLSDSHPILKAKVNGQLYEVMEMIKSEKMFEAHNLSFDDLVRPFWGNSLVDKEYVKSIVENFAEQSQYRNDLVDSGGEGYDNIFKEELDEMMGKFSGLIYNIQEFLSDRIEESYLSEKDSKINDLSILNGVVRFYSVSHYFAEFDAIIEKILSEIRSAGIVEKADAELFVKGYKEFYS